MATTQQKIVMWSGLIFSGLVLAYSIYMLMFLEDTGKKCANKLSKRDRQFRKAAVIITWIDVILAGLYCVGLIIGLLSGAGKGISLGMDFSYTPASSTDNVASMDFN